MCSCGCNTCGGKAPLLKEGKTFNQPLSENLLYHINNKKPLLENTFRYGSPAFLSLWKEARKLYSRDIIDLGPEDKQIIVETQIGEYGIYEGELVPLDLPMVSEVNLNSAGVKDLIRRVVKDSKLLDFLNFNTVKDFLKFIQHGSLDDYYEIDNEVRQYDSRLDEAKYQGKEVQLNKPRRGGTKKYFVYVMNPKTKKVKKVSFGGTTGLNVKIDDPKARHSFAARHKCAQEKNKLSPNYWGCHIGRYWKSLGGSKNFSGYW